MPTETFAAFHELFGQSAAQDKTQNVRICSTQYTIPQLILLMCQKTTTGTYRGMRVILGHFPIITPRHHFRFELFHDDDNDLFSCLQKANDKDVKPSAR